METITWNDEFSVNVKEIDSQHKRFIRFLREAYTKMDRALEPGELDPLLNSIKEHADEHFATEEKYFWKFDYKYGDYHAGLHKNTKEEILKFKERHKDDYSQSLAIELVDFLEDWLLVHMLKHDKLYMENFNAHGLF